MKSNTNSDNSITNDNNFYKSLNDSYATSFLVEDGGSNQEKQDILEQKGRGFMEMQQRYKEYLCGEYTNKTTIKNNYNAVKRFCIDVGGDFSKEKVRKWKEHINNTKAHNTINVYTNAVSRFLIWAKIMPKENPWIKTKGQEDTDKPTLTEQEIKTLINNSKDNPETHLIVQLLFHALRPKDIINIKISNLKGDTLYLKETKTGNNHTVLTKTIINAWEDYLKIRPKPNKEYEDYLLICNHSNWKGKAYATTLPIQKKIKQLAKENGININVTPYTIRRTCGTLRFNKDSEFYLGNPRNIQRLFRHKNIQTTLRYDHTTDDDLRKALQETEKDLIETGKDLIETGKDLTQNNVNKKGLIP